ncbi:plexin-B2-like [Scleropages formosus]|uniref:plexin-B2-like n=1 Tax=Scleropages formosus TaxID=113540 RepID=UPI0010FA668B|nr:plexin-B2-like [Scleropages formosus]
MSTPAGRGPVVEVVAAANLKIAAEPTREETTIVRVEATTASPAEEAVRPENSPAAPVDLQRRRSSLHCAARCAGSANVADGGLKEYKTEHLWWTDRRIITVHVFNPFVPAEAIRAFLQRHINLLPGHRDIRDVFGIWNESRQFKARLRPDPVAPDELHHPPCLQALSLVENKTEVMETAMEMAAGAGEALSEASDVRGASPAPTLAEIQQRKKEEEKEKEVHRRDQRDVNLVFQEWRKEMAWWTLAVLLLSLSIVCCAESIQEFTSSTLINNVVQDPLTGRIYVGAINAIYQLDSLLKQEKKVETGPKRDSRHCTPSIQSCHDAKMTDNTNKLLLVHPSNGSLIVCGSLFKGICSLRKLSSIDHLIYYNDSKGEKAYVVSSEETVSVVGVMSTFTKENDTFDVFVVGKGYGSQGNVKLISTPILQDFGNWDVFEDIVEAPAIPVTPFVKKYRHNFRYSFKESGFIYFLFTRTRGGLHNKNFTFISRLCEDDHHYYSYMELQLSCGPNNMYNKAQAAFVSSPGKELARNLSASGQYGQVRSQDKVLFVVSSTDEDKPRSGLCMYPLRYINQRIMEIISACYTKNGKIGNKVAVDSPYTTSAHLLCSVSVRQDTLTKYKCSADFLPSPLASTPGFALAAQAVHTTRDLLTAVAVAVEAERTVAFLGTSNGKVYHVHLSSTPEVYRTVPGPSSGEAVNKHLLFDRNHRYLYVTTGKRISMVPVEECDMMKDCKSCMDLKDPYCGWCALEGR